MTARVLVVDDLLPNVRLLEAKLTAEYFDIITATDGPGALAVMRTDPPDIVLLDVMMPGMDGLEVCRQIKSDPKLGHIPVVMVTALSDRQNRVRGLEAGADDFLTKPVNDVALLARVRSLVRLKMMMDEWRMREETYSNFGMIHYASGAADEDSGFNANILIVDDSEFEINKMMKALNKNGNNVTVVHSDSEAFLATREQSFDLIFISLLMKKVDGLRLSSLLRTHDETRQVPIILVMEEEDTVRLAKGLDLGANDYAIKPLEPAELEARARTQIKRKRYQDRLRGNFERSLTMALTDGLTGLHNRRYLDSHLGGLVKRAKESLKPLCILMFDIDHFKQVNDQHGHRVGDEVLQELAARVRRNVRGFDMTARYGGEEFIVVMPDTSIDVAATVAERLRTKIASKPFDVSGSVGALTVTVSLGVACLASTEEHVDDLVNRADEALFEAKRTGRDRIVLSQTPLPPGQAAPLGHAVAGIEDEDSDIDGTVDTGPLS